MCKLSFPHHRPRQNNPKFFLRRLLHLSHRIQESWRKNKYTCCDGMYGCYLTKRFCSRLLLHRFVINCDLLLNRRTATWKEQNKMNNKLASYRLTVREFVLVYGIFKSQMLRFVRLCSAAWLLLVQSRKIANTFSKLHWASRSDDTFCEYFFQVSISKATCKRTQPTTPNYVARG